jgi:hypothetical protein
MKAPKRTAADLDLERPGEVLVKVRRQWNSDRIATVPLDRLVGFHWSSTGGGSRYALYSPFRGVSPRPFLAAYMNCLAAVDGGVAHSGFHGDCPHQIKVVIVAKDNPVPLMKMLKARYPRPGGSR